MQQLGKYQLLELLGQGGMGAVYRSFHPVLSQPVAVKVMQAGMAADPQAGPRFLREAQVVAGLSHPGIVNIFDVDVQDGQPYIVMELLPAGSLAARLKNLGTQSTRSNDTRNRQGNGAVLYDSGSRWRQLNGNAIVRITG